MNAASVKLRCVSPGETCGWWYAGHAQAGSVREHEVVWVRKREMAKALSPTEAQEAVERLREWGIEVEEVAS